LEEKIAPIFLTAQNALEQSLKQVTLADIIDDIYMKQRGIASLQK